MNRVGAVKVAGDADIARAAPRARPYKLWAGRSVYVLVQPSGAKWWRCDVRRNGKRTTLSLGTFPGTSLAEAMAERDRIHKQARMGINPAAARKAAREGATLGGAGVAFGVALSDDGELSVTLDKRTFYLTKYQTDTVRCALLAQR
ncbi:MAG: DUF4102 domain-containing protein [Nevskiaceae bacterium]|nr:MAG: DUF4102 domain-containing protein [Nevskiaceae bacterium]TBR72267.1 MAG: DUF4102 domain-containing protein [Nevskiaceae bacterium]